MFGSQLVIKDCKEAGGNFHEDRGEQSRIKTSGNALSAAGGGPVKLQLVYFDLPSRFQKLFDISSMWSTEFIDFSSRAGALLLMGGTTWSPSPYDINSRYFSIYLQFQTELPNSPKDTNAKSMVSWSTAISTFQCSPASLLPIPFLYVSHIAYFKLTKPINFICFKLQTHTTICVCKAHTLFLSLPPYIYMQTQKFREKAIVSQRIIHQCFSSPSQGNPWDTRGKWNTASYENGC